MFGLGLPELMVVLVIALVVFGPSKLPSLGKSLGEAIRGFKKGLEDDSTFMSFFRLGSVTLFDVDEAVFAEATKEKIIAYKKNNPSIVFYSGRRIINVGDREQLLSIKKAGRTD